MVIWCNAARWEIIIIEIRPPRRRLKDEDNGVDVKEQTWRGVAKYI